MNAGMIGADPEILRRMAKQFDDAAHELMGVKGAIGPWVAMTNIWLGLNYHLFKDMWETTGAKTIVDAASIFHHCADLLRSNADEQDGASAADGGGGQSGSGLFGGGSGSVGVGGGGGGGGWGNSKSENFELDLEVPAIVHGFVADSIKATKLGSDAIGFVNHRQFAAAALEGNIPLMDRHFTAQFQAYKFSEFLSEAGDAVGHVGNALTVVGSIPDYISGSPEERLMAAIDISTVGLSYLGPVGKTGAGIIEGFKEVMPTTPEQQSDVVEYGLRQMYPDADINNLTPEQASAIGSRYDGLKGFGTMLADTAGNHVENGKGKIDDIRNTISDGIDYLRGMKWEDK